MGPVFTNRGMKKGPTKKSDRFIQFQLLRSEVWRRNHLCLTLI